MENETKKIGEFEYQFYMLPAMDSVRLLTRIFKIVSPLVALTSGDDDEKKKTSMLEKKMDISKIVEALQKSLDENEVDYIISKLMEQTICEGVGQLNNKATVNEHFKGRIKHLFQVVFAALGAQYSDFFTGSLEDVIQKIKVASGQTKVTRKG